MRCFTLLQEVFYVALKFHHQGHAPFVQRQEGHGCLQHLFRIFFENRRMPSETGTYNCMGTRPLLS